MKLGDIPSGREHNKYYEFHDSIRHDTTKCTMLRRELENKMQSGQLINIIRGL